MVPVRRVADPAGVPHYPHAQPSWSPASRRVVPGGRGFPGAARWAADGHGHRGIDLPADGLPHRRGRGGRREFACAGDPRPAPGAPARALASVQRGFPAAAPGNGGRTGRPAAAGGPTGEHRGDHRRAAGGGLEPCGLVLGPAAADRLDLPHGHRPPDPGPPRGPGCRRGALLRILHRTVRGADRGLGRAEAVGVLGDRLPPADGGVDPLPPHPPRISMVSSCPVVVSLYCSPRRPAGPAWSAPPGTSMACRPTSTGVSGPMPSSTASTPGCWSTSARSPRPNRGGPEPEAPFPWRKSGPRR